MLRVATVVVIVTLISGDPHISSPGAHAPSTTGSSRFRGLMELAVAAMIMERMTVASEERMLCELKNAGEWEERAKESCEKGLGRGPL